MKPVKVERITYILYDKAFQNQILLTYNNVIYRWLSKCIVVIR